MIKNKTNKIPAIVWRIAAICKGGTCKLTVYLLATQVVPQTMEIKIKHR